MLGPVDLREWIERVDHCGSCGGVFAPTEGDRCPDCANGGSGLVATWGAEQAAAFQNGARYANGGPGPDEDGPQLHWIICGGESGPGAREMQGAWILDLRAQCFQAGVAFHFKQTGAVLGKQYGFKDRAGADPAEWPAHLRVQQLPESP